jgi:hypothetical protein
MICTAGLFVPAFASVVVVPNAQTSTVGNDSSGSLAGPIAGLEYQQVFESSRFPSLTSLTGTLLITSFEFRAKPGTGSINGTVSSMSLYMSTTPYSANSLPGQTLITPNFAANLGPDNTLVLSHGPGPLWSSSGCAGPGPCPFDMAFTFTTPFSYDPSRGNLLFDFEITGYNGSGTGEFDVQNFGSFGGAVTSVNGPLGSPTGQVFDSFGHLSGNITQFNYTVVPAPEPSTFSCIALLTLLLIAGAKYGSART